MGKSGLSIQTLAISAAAAVAAAVIIPLFWEQGTLIATAMTPVLVALVSEALRKPAEKITAVTPKVTRRGTRVDEVQFDPLPPGEELEAPRSDDPFGLRTARPRPRPRVRHHWRLALATGATAFAIAVAGLTMSELVLGGAATRDDGRTTFFPGREARQAEDEKEEPEATATPEAEEEEPTAAPTETPEATPVPTETPTSVAPPTETPAPSPAPTP